MPQPGVGLWLTHPLRMYQFAFGSCPVCNSSPPWVDCYVCRGSYEYGPKNTPERMAQWLERFRIWVRHS